MRRTPYGGRDAVLEGACMTLGNKHTYANFIDSSLFIASGAREIFSLSIGGFAENKCEALVQDKIELSSMSQRLRLSSARISGDLSYFTKIKHQLKT